MRRMPVNSDLNAPVLLEYTSPLLTQGSFIGTKSYQFSQPSVLHLFALGLVANSPHHKLKRQKNEREIVKYRVLNNNLKN